MLCFHALLFAIRAESFSLPFVHSFVRLLFCTTYAIWVINEHFENIVSIRFFFIGNTQNGSPFVIRDVFMCFRLENQVFLFPNQKESAFPSSSVLISLFFCASRFISSCCYFKKQFNTRKSSQNVYSSFMGIKCLMLRAIMLYNVTICAVTNVWRNFF